MMNLDAIKLIKDTAFVFFLSYWSGYLGGVFDLVSTHYAAFIALNYSFVCFGFVCLGWWTDHHKKQHSLCVALFLWVLSITETAFLGVWHAWFVSGLWTFSACFLGLGVSGLWSFNNAR